jgi:predicted alpha/beta hydrolase
MMLDADACRRNGDGWPRFQVGGSSTGRLVELFGAAARATYCQLAGASAGAHGDRMLIAVAIIAGFLAIVSIPDGVAWPIGPAGWGRFAVWLMAAITAIVAHGLTVQ